MAINYEQVGWDTSKYVNPTRMNHMDDGIKAACDKADAHDQQIETINSNLNQKAKIKRPKYVNIPGESSVTVVIEEDFGVHYLFTVTCINTQYYYVGLVLNDWQDKGIIPIIKSNYISVTYNNNTFEIFNTNSSGMDFMYSLVEI